MVNEFDGEETVQTNIPHQEICLTDSPDKNWLLEQSLVLASEGHRHSIRFDGDRFSLWVPNNDQGMAAKTLATYELENRGFFNPEIESDPGLDLHLGPLLHLFIPAMGYFLVAHSPWPNWLDKRGHADAIVMLQGEWWRGLTATSLHADHTHLLGNLLSGYFIFNLLQRRLGIGSIMLLLTIAAFAANISVALISPAGHLSVGFSTVVFAGLGCLAVVESMARRAVAGLRWRKVIPLIGAFLLATLTGLGENADVKAHFLGFFYGVLVGFMALTWQAKSKSLVLQSIQVVFVYALYAGAWILALGAY